MAGSYGVSGGRYLLDGVYGTAEEHAARQQATQVKKPYDAAAPSAGAAGAAARNANPNLDFNVGSTGTVTYSNTSLQGRAATDQQARIAAEAEKQKALTAQKAEALKRSQTTADRDSILALIQKTQGGGGAAPVTHGGSARVEADARAAAFSRAKDQAGQIARSSLTSIAEQMGNRGISGSGIEALQQAGAIGGAGDELIDVTRDQAMFEAKRAGDVSDMSYQGDITQRGQDLSNRQSLLALYRSLY